MKCSKGTFGDASTSVSRNDTTINRFLLFACKLNGLGPAAIDPYLPRRVGLRNTTAFKCLIHVQLSPGLTKAGYSRLYKTCQQSTCHIIDYLLELQLIQTVGKPRLIIPFQAYKIDTGYKITSHGLKVVRSVLDKADLLI
jgi:hypothetical protein